MNKTGSVANRKILDEEMECIKNKKPVGKTGFQN
jgi:hypothetical protein